MVLKVLLWLLALSFGFMALAVALGFMLNSARFNKATPINPELSNQYFVKDNQVVFVSDGNFFNLGASTLPDADPAYFVVLDSHFGKDKHSVYFQEKKLVGADPDSVKLLTHPYSDKPTGYLVTKSGVFMYYHPIDGANPETFEVLWGHYSRDESHVFYLWDIKIAIDGKPKPMPNQPDYLLMGNSVYRKGIKVSNDAMNFRILVDERYQADSKSVYFSGDELSGITPNRFKILSRFHTQHGSEVFYSNERINGATAKQFLPLSDHFSKDNEFVYYQTRRLINAGDFELWGRTQAAEREKFEHWSLLPIDDRHVQLVARQKVESFAPGWQQAQGKLYTAESRLDGINPTDLTFLDKDKGNYYIAVNPTQQIFYFGREIDGADLGSFTTTAGDFSRDRERVYYQEHPLADIKPEDFTYTPQLQIGLRPDGAYYLKQTPDD